MRRQRNHSCERSDTGHETNTEDDTTDDSEDYSENVSEDGTVRNSEHDGDVEHNFVGGNPIVKVYED